MISLVLLRLFCFGFSDFSCNSCPVNLSFWWLLLGQVCWLHLLTLCPVQGSKALFALPLNSRCAYCKYDCRLFIHSMYFLWFTVSDNHGFYRFDLLTVLCAFFFWFVYFQSFAWKFSFIVKKMLCINISTLSNLDYVFDFFESWKLRD